MTIEQSTEIVLPIQDADRFWRKVRKTKTCWLWRGAGSGNGSGYFKLDGKSVKASHVAWQIANSEFPPAGMFVVPSCGNAKCVRPEHLKLQREKLSADRRTTKLTSDQVAEIKRRSDHEGVSQRQLAAAYGVSQQAIQKILAGKAWKRTTTEQQTSANRPSGKTSKPEKPYPDFPLTAHPSGRWCKKIRGKLHYFGPWNDWQGALDRFQRQRDDLYAGRKPRDEVDGLSVRDLCNQFLTAKKARRDGGEISPLTFNDYHRTCGRIVRVMGKTRVVDDLGGDDFDKLRAEMAKTCGLVAQGNEINRTRMVFKYAYDAGLVNRPVRFGANFTRPSRKAIRRQRTPRMYEANEIQLMLDHASAHLKAMILLGVNCGFGNTDVGRLTTTALDLEDGWANFPRSKTGSLRRCPLWPETIEAITQAIDHRPTPASDEEKSLVFLTQTGRSWYKESTTYLSEQFRRFVKKIDVEGKSQIGSPHSPLYRRGVGFYTLRHVFETIAGESRDQVAVDFIMGHERGDMASAYRERISDERLVVVTECVHNWLFKTDDSRGKSS